MGLYVGDQILVVLAVISPRLGFLSWYITAYSFPTSNHRRFFFFKLPNLAQHYHLLLFTPLLSLQAPSAVSTVIDNCQ